MHPPRRARSATRSLESSVSAAGFDVGGFKRAKLLQAFLAGLAWPRLLLLPAELIWAKSGRRTVKKEAKFQRSKATHRKREAYLFRHLATSEHAEYLEAASAD